MAEDPRELLRRCLYFTAGALSRTLTRMAEEEFAAVGLSPSQALLLMLAAAHPGSAQKQLGEALELAPSTVTRMIDALERRGLVERRSEGRSALIGATRSGAALAPTIHQAWGRLHERYSQALGRSRGDELCLDISDAARKLPG